MRQQLVMMMERHVGDIQQVLVMSIPTMLKTLMITHFLVDHLQCKLN